MEKSNAVNLAILILRIAVGVIFIAHGAQKVFGVFGGSGIGGFSGILENKAFIFPSLMAWAVALSEFFGGILLVLGIIPRISAFLISIIMLVAVIGIHGPNGFFAANGGFEYPFMLLMASIALMLTGGGKFSLFDKF